MGLLDIMRMTNITTIHEKTWILAINNQAGSVPKEMSNHKSVYNTCTDQIFVRNEHTDLELSGWDNAQTDLHEMELSTENSV